MARADDDTRITYDEHVLAILRELRAGLEGESRDDHAIAILALLSGGLSMAHAVHDQRLGARIAHAVVDAVAVLGNAPQPGKKEK